MLLFSPPLLQHPRPIGGNQDPSGFDCGRAQGLGLVDFVGGCADSSADALAVYYINVCPSPTEAHAGTLLFLRSDGPLYKCTRATALWLSSGGPRAAKRKCPSMPLSSQFRIKTGTRRALVKYKPTAQFAPFWLWWSKERKSCRIEPRRAGFLQMSRAHASQLFTPSVRTSLRATLTRTTQAVPANYTARAVFYRP